MIEIKFFFKLNQFKLITLKNNISLTKKLAPRFSKLF